MKYVDKSICFLPDYRQECQTSLSKVADVKSFPFDARI